MKMNKYLVLYFALGPMLLVTCQPAPVCPAPTGTPHYLTLSELEELPFPSNPSSGPAEIEINGKMTSVDQVVTGPLCNGEWKGTVYVACDVQVFEWKEQPLFLKDCDLSIEPGTVVYVAAHNDAPYYNGCSCHTSTKPEH